MTGITHGTALWYASRATGVVTLLLLTAVLLLGILVNRQGRLPGLPSFAVTGLHRNVSLLAVAFLAIHVITAIGDPYVTIGLAAGPRSSCAGVSSMKTGFLQAIRKSSSSSATPTCRRPPSWTCATTPPSS